MENYTFKLPEWMLKKLKKKAESKASTVSQEIRTAISKHLDK